ncbi:hypothetical protein GGR53DRAFT_512975 [Hypoxylon sp. FL1150]|nr:hypothetical protein GGR53DRAFT_512975 [Hypoxylon sp. FL1150]
MLGRLCFGFLSGKDTLPPALHQLETETRIRFDVYLESQSRALDDTIFPEMASINTKTSLATVMERPEAHRDKKSPTDDDTSTADSRVESSTPSQDEISDDDDVIFVSSRAVDKPSAPQNSQPKPEPEPNRRLRPYPKSKPGPSRVLNASSRHLPRLSSPSFSSLRLPAVEMHQPFQTTAEIETRYTSARTEPANYALSSKSHGELNRVKFVHPCRLPEVSTLCIPPRPRSADGNRAGAFQQRYSGAFLPSMGGWR